MLPLLLYLLSFIGHLGKLYLPFYFISILTFYFSVLRQCEDRVHRIGQKDDCDIRYLVAKNTLDENIWYFIYYFDLSPSKTITLVTGL